MLHVENVYWKEDKVSGCLGEQQAVNSMLMNLQIFSKMYLNKNTLEIKLCIGQSAKCVERLKGTTLSIYGACMCGVLTCMCITCVQGPLRLEEGARICGTIVIKYVSHHVGAVN